MSGPSHEQQRTLWWHTAIPAPATESIPSSLSVDVAVIGGGFTGLTATLHLATKGVRVTLLEAESIGSRASGLNAGFVVPNFAKADPASVMAKLGSEQGRRLLELVGRGGERVFGLIREWGIECDAAQTGWLQPASSEVMERTLQMRAAAWQELGKPVRYLDARETAALTSVRGYRGALFDPTGGTIHPLSYARGLMKAALGAGALIFENAEVAKIEYSGNRWILRVGGSQIDAEKVLLCTNAGARGAAKQLFRAIVPLAVYQIATQPLPSDLVARISPGRHPVSDTRSNIFTYRLDRDNRLISGGMSVFPIGAHHRMAQGIVKRLAEELHLGFVPTVEYVWRGVAAMTTDFMPHLYEFGPGFVGGIGCNGRGVAMTAMLGGVLAEAALGTPLSKLPVPEAPARPCRFIF